MTITVEFTSIEEMGGFARTIVRNLENETAGEQPVEAAPQEEPIAIQNAPAHMNPPVYTQPVQAPPVQAPPVQAPPVYTQPVQAPPVQVQTSTKTYTVDELAGAATVLMDKGMQNQLLQLLAQYGVDSLPALPPQMYGDFATALRGLGAQI